MVIKLCRLDPLHSRMDWFLKPCQCIFTIYNSYYIYKSSKIETVFHLSKLEIILPYDGVCHV